jgi:DNA-binding Xre family transcriptional regulator
MEPKKKSAEKPKRLKLNLREVLSKTGKSRYELAEILDLHYRTISSLLTGEQTRVEISTLEKICLNFNLKVEDLFVWE